MSPILVVVKNNFYDSFWRPKSVLLQKNKTMEICIHRGSREIGGTCIQIRSKNKTIAIDAGTPLTSDNLNTDYIHGHFDAVIISHSHQDHFGLIEQLNKKTAVYINRVQLDLINASRYFRGLPPLNNHFVFYDIAQPFSIGNFTFHPYLVDHSAPNAFAFLIECEGKRLFYSGDFRGHGRKAWLFEKQMRTPQLKDLDLMFMEGTMMERNNHDYPTEEDVQHKITELLKADPHLAFLISSSQNIDRITSAFKACRDSGRELVLDFYTLWVLYQLRGVSKTIDEYLLKNIRTLGDGRLVGGQYGKMQTNKELFDQSFRELVFAKPILKFDDLNKTPENYLVMMRTWGLKYLFNFQNPLVIYSQWNGYLDEPEYAYAHRLREKMGKRWVYAHTSGHAVVEDMKAFVGALRPKVLIPIHTLHPEGFEREFGGMVEVRFLNEKLYL